MSQSDDPFAQRDVTILRPRPGVGRRPQATPAAPAATPPAPGPVPGPVPAGSQPQAPSTPAPSVQPPTAAGALLVELPGATINPLVQGAVPLLLLAGRLRAQLAPADGAGLRAQALQEIRAFEERARRAEVPAEDILAARYALCTVVDEAVLNTPWGAQSGWAAQSLLVTLHREASGGEKFFQILERVAGEPQRYLALLELLYVCLALGFEGKYRLVEQGAAQLEEIRRRLYQQIRSLREGIESELSPRWKGVDDRRNAVLRFVPLWVVAAACALALFGAWLYFDARLGAQAEPLNAALAGVGLERFAAPSAPAPTPSGLRELLAAQIAGGALTVEEAGGRTTITLTVPDLFASASAQVNERHGELLRQVGAALERVPGRIVVVGHTDDLPLRSLRFKDNYELSRARAGQVAELLGREVADPARIQTAGKGALEPRYLPAELPENRARNRRVEIIHLREG